MKVSTWLLKVKDLASKTLDKVEGKGAKAFKSFNQASSSIDRWMRKVRVQSHRAEKGINRIRGSISNLMPSLGGLRSMALAAFAAFSIQSAVSSIIRFGSEAQKAKIAYEVMLGSVEKGNAMYKQLQDFANVTPFDNASVNKAAQTLLQFGMAGQDVLSTLQMLGDVSAGDKQKFDSLTLAFGQMQSAGKLMGQDLLQMINAGFNPLQQMSKDTGKSMGVLKEEMSKGAISSQQVMNAFKNATKEGGQFHGMMDRMSQTFSGRWSTAMGKIQLLAIEIFDRIEPALMSIMEVVIDVVDVITTNLDNIIPVLYGVGAAVGVIAGGFLAMKIQMIAALGITKLVTAAQWLLNIALTANPIGIVVVAIGALVGALVYLYNTSGKVRGAIKGLWGAAKALFTGLKTMGMKILGGIGDLLAGIFTFDKDRIAKGLSSLKTSFSKLGSDIAEEFQKNYQIGVDEIKVKNEKKDKKDPADVLAAGGGGGSPQSSVSDGLQGVSGSGRSVRNVTVNIENVGTGTVIQATRVEEGAQDIQRMVQEYLIRAIQGAELAAG